MRFAPILAAALLVAPAVSARTMKPSAAVKSPAAMKPVAATPAPPKSGVRAEFLHDLDDVEKKIMQLAMAMPAGKYSWRPAHGVRSVSEVYMHIAGGNYFVAATIAARPMGADPELGGDALQQIRDKDRVLDELRKSFDQLRSAILSASDADLDKPVRMYDEVSTERATFMTALNHLHEHLGQSIAYARMNGVVPPWSAM